ncbi:PTS ascorbate transporter subunit IIC [Staphylococcus cohnii]|uniref:PTS ascorbate transporter subunit IIC n=1 Tax=Staphylococcus cohnii TaxID=29382 RepID=UPI003D7E09F4
MQILYFFKDLISEPAILMGLIAMVGLIALKSPGHKIFTGTMGPILGYLMLSAGANVIVQSLDPLSKMIEKGFHIKGIVPNNEAITSVAQEILGVETMSILIVGLLFNLIIARFTRYKYIFLTGHHSFFMACLLSAVLGALDFKGVWLVLIGGFILGAWSSISPAIGQRFTMRVTDNEELAVGHFGSIGYYLAAFIGSIVGKGSPSTEDIEVNEKWSFLRNTTISTALTMIIIYLIASIAAGSDYVATLSDGKSPYLFAILTGLKFAVGVAIVYAGVRMILADLIPAFQGIATKVIPNSVPAVDCAVFFTFAQTAVIIGFLSSFVGGLVGMAIVGVTAGIFIIPGLVPHFFTGATAGIFGNATGGRRGAIIGAFVNGLLVTFLPAMLLPVLGDLGFKNTTFGDVDFGILGVILGNVGHWFGHIGIYIILLIIIAILVIPSFLSNSKTAINNVEVEEQ